MTYGGSDHSVYIRDQFKSLPDEFVHLSTAGQTLDMPISGSTSEEIAAVAKAVDALIEVVVRQAARAKDAGRDMKIMADELGQLASISLQTTNNYFKQFTPISKVYSSLSVQWPEASEKYHETVVEKLRICQDVLLAFDDLCSRMDPKTMEMDHKKGLEKIRNLKMRKIRGILASDSQLYDNLENRVVAMESYLTEMECRQKFSNFCLDQERIFVAQHTSEDFATSGVMLVL